jgi:hypothetical protein
MSVVRSPSDRVSEPAEPVAPPICARRLLLILGGAFERPAGGVHGLGARQPRFRARRDLNERCGRETAQAAAKQHSLPRSTHPRRLQWPRATTGASRSLPWRMLIRPEVVATVIYEGAGAKARAIVTTTPAPGLAHRRCCADCRAVGESACPRHTLFARRQGHQCRQPRRVRRAR